MNNPSPRGVYKEITMIVTTKELFKAAYGKYAIGAYNINNLEQTMGLFRGNLDSEAPFIIQISKGARSYTHKLMLEPVPSPRGTRMLPEDAVLSQVPWR